MIRLFQHAGAPAHRRQIRQSPLGRLNPLRWSQNSAWDGQIGWSQELPVGVWMPSTSTRVDVDVRKRNLGDGSDSYVRGVDSRTLEVEGVVDGIDTEAAFLLERQIKSWSQRPFLKLSYRDDCYANLGALRDIRWDARPGSSRSWNRVRIVWQLDDPYWYALQRTEIFQQGSTGQDVVSNGLEDNSAEAFPLIEVFGSPQSGHDDFGEIPQGNALTWIQSTGSEEDGGAVFTVGDPGLTGSDVIRVDSELGTVLRGVVAPESGQFSLGKNLIESFSGELFPLYPGENLIDYSGGYSYRKISWRRRWL